MPVLARMGGRAPQFPLLAREARDRISGSLLGRTGPYSGRNLLSQSFCIEAGGCDGTLCLPLSAACEVREHSQDKWGRRGS